MFSPLKKKNGLTNSSAPLAPAEQDYDDAEDGVPAQYNTLASPLPPPGLGGWSVPLILTSVLAVAVLAMAFMHSPSVQIAQGELQPVAGGLDIRAPRAGRIGEALKSAGEPVQADTVLFTIDTDQTTDQGRTLGKEEFDHALNTRASLGEELRQRRELATLEAADLAERLRAGQDDLARIRRELVLQNERTRLSTESADAGRALHARGLFSSLSLRQREEVVLQMRQAEVQLEGRIATTQAAQRGLEAQLRRIGPETATTILELERLQAEQDNHIVQLQAAAKTLINAPKAGLLATIRVRPGQVVEAGELLATILPSDQTLQAEIWIPSKAIGRIKPGDKVRIMYDAFPYERYGLQQAIVTSLSRTPLPPEVSPAGIATGEPMYKVLAQLPQQAIASDGELIPLQPGLRLEANFVLEQRSVLTWLFEPLVGALKRGAP